VTAPSRRVFLDANVLLLLYVGTFDPELISRFKRTRHYTEEDFDVLQRLVGSFAEIVTTPHVLAEVSNLSNHLPEYLRGEYFALFAKSVSVLAESHTHAAKLVEEPIFARLGLTDAAIAQLARDESLTVVTADLDLHVHLLTLGVTTLNFNEMTSLAAFVETLPLN
jgi:rRNA-processing protein FCF1